MDLILWRLPEVYATAWAGLHSEPRAASRADRAGPGATSRAGSVRGERRGRAGANGDLRRPVRPNGRSCCALASRPSGAIDDVALAGQCTAQLKGGLRLRPGGNSVAAGVLGCGSSLPVGRVVAARISRRAGAGGRVQTRSPPADRGHLIFYGQRVVLGTEGFPLTDIPLQEMITRRRPGGTRPKP